MTISRTQATQFAAIQPAVFALAWRLLGSKALAEATTHQVWLEMSRQQTLSDDTYYSRTIELTARACRRRVLASQGEGTRSTGRNFLPMTKEPSVEGDTGTVNAFHPGPEMLNKLESLPVDERFAVVMHVIYAMPIADVARLLATTPANARLVAGRAVQAMHPMGEHFDPDVDRGRVESFLIASESGTFEQMVTLLKPDAVITADQAAVQMGALPEITGAAHVARRFFGRATGIRLAMINGLAGAILAPGDEVVIVFRFHYLGEKVARIDLIADPNTLRTLDVCVLEPESREHMSE